MGATDIMLLDRPFVIFRDTIDEHSADPVPLVVLEVLEFDMRKLGITRVLRVDPHEVWKTRRPDKVALVEHLVPRVPEGQPRLSRAPRTRRSRREGFAADQTAVAMVILLPFDDLHALPG